MTADEREAKGNPGHRHRRAITLAKGERRGSATPSQGAGSVAILTPRGLPREQRNIWASLVPDLTRTTALRQTDVPLFTRYVAMLARWFDLEQDLRGCPLVVTTTSEHVTMDRLDKRFQAWLLIDRRLCEIEDRLGMNPQSRQQLLARMANAPPVNPGLFGPGAPGPEGASGEGVPPRPDGEGGDPLRSPVGFLSGRPN